MSHDTLSITQMEPKVKNELYQPNTDRAAILALADLCLKRANFHLARALVNDDPEHWRLYKAHCQDRAALLEEVGHDGL